MRKVTHLTLMIFTITVFAACSGSNKLSTNPADIQGSWELTSLNGSQVSGEGYTLNFNTDGTIAGHAGCNYYAGKYDAQKEGVLDLTSVSATEIKCKSGTQSDSYVSSIKNADSFQVKGGNQLMLNTSDSGTIVFTKQMKQEEG